MTRFLTRLTAVFVVFGLLCDPAALSALPAFSARPANASQSLFVSSAMSPRSGVFRFSGMNRTSTAYSFAFVGGAWPALLDHFNVPSYLRGEVGYILAGVVGVYFLYRWISKRKERRKLEWERPKLNPDVHPFYVMPLLGANPEEEDVIRRALAELKVVPKVDAARIPYINVIPNGKTGDSYRRKDGVIVLFMGLQNIHRIQEEIVRITAEARYESDHMAEAYWKTKVKYHLRDRIWRIAPYLTGSAAGYPSGWIMNYLARSIHHPELKLILEFASYAVGALSFYVTSVLSRRLQDRLAHWGHSFVDSRATGSAQEDFEESYMYMMLHRSDFEARAHSHPRLASKWEAMQQIVNNRMKLEPAPPNAKEKPSRSRQVLSVGETIWMTMGSYTMTKIAYEAAVRKSIGFEILGWGYVIGRIAYGLYRKRKTEEALKNESLQGYLSRPPTNHPFFDISIEGKMDSGQSGYLKQRFHRAAERIPAIFGATVKSFKLRGAHFYSDNDPRLSGTTLSVSKDALATKEDLDQAIYVGTGLAIYRQLPVVKRIWAAHTKLSVMDKAEFIYGRELGVPLLAFTIGGLLGYMPLPHAWHSAIARVIGYVTLALWILFKNQIKRYLRAGLFYGGFKSQNAFVTPEATISPERDFAESFAFYGLHPVEYAERARNSPAQAARFHAMEDIFALGVPKIVRPLVPVQAAVKIPQIKKISQVTGGLWLWAAPLFERFAKTEDDKVNPLATYSASFAWWLENIVSYVVAYGIFRLAEAVGYSPSGFKESVQAISTVAWVFFVVMHTNTVGRWLKSKYPYRSLAPAVWIAMPMVFAAFLPLQPATLIVVNVLGGFFLHLFTNAYLIYTLATPLAGKPGQALAQTRESFSSLFKLISYLTGSRQQRRMKDAIRAQTWDVSGFTGIHEVSARVVKHYYMGKLNAEETEIVFAVVNFQNLALRFFVDQNNTTEYYFLQSAEKLAALCEEYAIYLKPKHFSPLLYEWIQVVERQDNAMSSCIKRFWLPRRSTVDEKEDEKSEWVLPPSTFSGMAVLVTLLISMAAALASFWFDNPAASYLFSLAAPISSAMIPGAAAFYLFVRISRLSHDIGQFKRLQSVFFYVGSLGFVCFPVALYQLPAAAVKTALIIDTFVQESSSMRLMSAQLAWYHGRWLHVLLSAAVIVPMLLERALGLYARRHPPSANSLSEAA